MKKAIKLIVFILAVIFINTGCDKDDHDEKDTCQLQSVVWNDGYSLIYTYNSRGLVNTWTEDYYGDIYANTFTYNDQGKLISSRNVIPDGNAYTNKFYYEKGKVVRLTSNLESSSELINDIRHTYNNRGQMTSLDDILQDAHSDFFYNARGDFIRNDFYFSGILTYKIEYEYLFENRNAFLALPGIDSWWTSYNSGLFAPRWESTTKITYYEGSDEYVILDYDPASIVMETGQRNYITYTSFFDRATNTPGDITFTYANCGGNNAESKPASGVKKVGGINIKNRLNRIMRHTNKNIKKEIIELNNELRQSERN